MRQEDPLPPPPSSLLFLNWSWIHLKMRNYQQLHTISGFRFFKDRRHGCCINLLVSLQITATFQNIHYFSQRETYEEADSPSSVYSVKERSTVWPTNPTNSYAGHRGRGRISRNRGSWRTLLDSFISHGSLTTRFTRFNLSVNWSTVPVAASVPIGIPMRIPMTAAVTIMARMTVVSWTVTVIVSWVGRAGTTATSVRTATVMTVSASTTMVSVVTRHFRNKSAKLKKKAKNTPDFWKIVSYT